MSFHIFVRIRKLLKDLPTLRTFYKTLGALVVIATLHTIFFKITESVGWEEAIWQTWQTFTTVGYGNAPANTSGGRWTTMFWGTLGIALLPLIISGVIENKLEKINRRKFGVNDNPIRNGIVVFNFSSADQIRGLILQIQHVRKDMGFCIIDEKLDELPPSVASLKNVEFLKGECLRESTYKRANLDKNNTTIIFPKEPGQSSSDGLTRLIIDQVSKFMNRKGRIIYLVVDSENDHLFEDCPGVSVYEAFEIYAIAQEITDPFSSELIEKLLLNTYGANPKTLTPTKIIGWNWMEFQLNTIQLGAKQGIAVNPLGLIKDSKTYSCPAWDTKIETGDLISMIGYDDFDWKKFEKDLVAAKAEAKT